MAIKFKRYERYDAVMAAKGFWYALEDENGNKYGSYLLSLYDPYSKRVQQETERFVREFKSKQIGDSKHANIYAMVQLCFHDWKGVLDENDKPVPFSKEAAFEFLIDETDAWAPLALINVMRDEANFKSDPVATQEEVAKN